MATKKTVVEMFKEIRGLCVTDEQRAFIDKRIEITEKKNASGKSGELTPKQREKMEQIEGYKNSIVASMAEGVAYTPTDLLKVVEGLPAECNTQRLTPMLTALVKENRLTKATAKGRSVYSLPSAEGESED